MLSLIVDLLAFGCINALMVLGFNLQYGYAGVLNFTYYTFVAVGAYIAAVTTMGPSPAGVGQETYILQWSLPWPVGLLLAGLAAVVLGGLILLIAVRRLRSDYLAIVTVALGYVLYEIFSNDTTIFDGSNGLYAVPQLAGTANLSTTEYSLVILGLAGILLVGAYWLSKRIFNSPYGRVLRALREDEVFALTYGKDVGRARTTVFLLGSFIGGLAGGLLVYYIGAWSPAAFTPLETFFLFAAIIIGGSGDYRGAVLGAFLVLELVTESSRFLPAIVGLARAGPLRAVVIGVALILVLRFRPAGILPERALRFYRRGWQPMQRLRGRAAPRSSEVEAS